MREEEFTIEGRNPVMEAFRSGKTVDRLFILDGCKDGPVLSIVREAKKQGSLINYVKKERLEQIDGLMPDPTNLPKGCKFHPRCKQCMDICREVEPQVYMEGEHKIKCHLFDNICG